MKSFLLTFVFSVLCLIGFALPTVSSFTPTSAASGMTVTITGSNFTDVTAVTFGGVAAASFTVVSATQITAVVAMGSSGQVAVTTVEGTGSKTGFYYVSTSGIITDYGGFWPSTAAAPNTNIPDNSHNLLAFTSNGITYSTGANDAALTSQNISFTAGHFRAFPVAGITGVVAPASSTYLALGKKVDGSADVANTPAVSGFSIKTVLTDGINGLDLGTGVTNLPAAAILTFQISNIDPAKVADDEPDLILTQIAQPVTGNDVYSFIDATGNVVGTSFSQDMTLLPKFGSYDLDLFNFTPNTPYNIATAYSAYATKTNREIRLIAVRLANFGITAANIGQVKALRITPSSNSDYAFIAYNADAINLPPNVTQNDAATNTTICSGGTANLAVIGAAAGGGTLSYSWEESTDGGATWTAVTNGNSYAGAATNMLSIVNAANGNKYRTIAQESGNPNLATSTVFTIAVAAPAAPTAVSISGGATTCLNNSVQLTSSVTGGSNLTYQWQNNAGGTYQDIAGATLKTYVPPVNQTGATSYNVRVSSGSGCPAFVTAATPATITVTGISSVTPASVCESGALTLGATATSPSTVSWYSADNGGTALVTSNTYNTPVLTASTTYYVASSGCASALRVPVVATVHPASNGGSIAGSTIVATGTNNTTLTLSGYTGSIIKWQSSTDNFSSNVTDIANTTPTLTATNLTQTTAYRTEIQSGTCNAALSNEATITVSSTLAIRNSSIKATIVTNGIAVQWTAYEQENTERFEVEKSVDGLHFTPVYAVLPTDVNNTDVTYHWLDENPVQGVNIYRIKEVSNSGSVTYSSTVRILYTKAISGILVFPNPVRSRNFQIQHTGVSAGDYRIRLTNNLGQVIYQKVVTHLGGTFTYPVQLPQQTNPGVYSIELLGNGIAESRRIQVL